MLARLVPAQGDSLRFFSQVLRAASVGVIWALGVPQVFGSRAECSLRLPPFALRIESTSKCKIGLANVARERFGVQCVLEQANRASCVFSGLGGVSSLSLIADRRISKIGNRSAPCPPLLIAASVIVTD